MILKGGLNVTERAKHGQSTTQTQVENKAMWQHTLRRLQNCEAASFSKRRRQVQVHPAVNRVSSLHRLLVNAWSGLSSAPGRALMSDQPSSWSPKTWLPFVFRSVGLGIKRPLCSGSKQQVRETPTLSKCCELLALVANPASSKHE